MQKFNARALVAAYRGAYPRIVAFWSASAFAQRSRDRERRKLVCELDGLDEQARYDKARRPILTERLQMLAREDMAATLRRTNFHFMSGPRDALKPDVGNRRFFVVDEWQKVDNARAQLPQGTLEEIRARIHVAEQGLLNVPMFGFDCAGNVRRQGTFAPPSRLADLEPLTAEQIDRWRVK